jgi:hypothetical protein
VVQIWPGRFVCKQVTVCPGHIWTTLYYGCTLNRSPISSSSYAPPLSVIRPFQNVDIISLDSNCVRTLLCHDQFPAGNPWSLSSRRPVLQRFTEEAVSKQPVRLLDQLLISSPSCREHEDLQTCATEPATELFLHHMNPVHASLPYLFLSSIKQCLPWYKSSWLFY